MTRWALRYKPSTDLGRRFTASAGDFATRQEADDLRRQCANADAMETVEIEEADE